MTDDHSFIFKIIFVCVLILLNGFFVAIEYALIRIRNSELESLIAKGNTKAILVRSIKQKLDLYISSTQLGITLIGLLLGRIGEDVFSVAIQPLLAPLALSDARQHGISFFVGIVIITYLSVTFGELVPKTLAIHYATRIALTLSEPLQIFYRIFRPFITFFSNSANFVVSLFGITQDKHEMHHTQEELRILISEGAKTGIIDETEHKLMGRIFDFNDKKISDIMIPRNLMCALSVDRTQDKIMDIVLHEGFSRVPVYEGTVDNIIGIIHTKTLLHALYQDDNFSLRPLLKAPYFLPESKHIGEVLADFQKKHVHMGVVVNEYGGVEGIVSVEDILEEIVGELDDEFDTLQETDQYITKYPGKGGDYIINPQIPVEDLNVALGLDLPIDEEAYSTLSGLLQHTLGHIPELNEKIQLFGLNASITKKAGSRIMQVRVSKDG